MKTSFFSHIILTILAVVAVLLVASFAFLLVKQEKKFRSSVIEFKSFQILTDVLEVYNEEGSFEPTIWPEVVGFAIYSVSGQTIYRFGSAPLVLKENRAFYQNGLFRLGKKSIIMVRPSAGFPLTRLDKVSGQRRGQVLRQHSLAFIEIDIHSLLTEAHTIYFVLYSLFFIFLIVLAFVFLLSRRISMYRLQVEESAHLVQLGEAARTLVHEIKNPLGIIRVQCATLKKTVPEERISNIAVIEEETVRLSNLANRVRDFLQSSEGLPAIFSCDYFLDACKERYGSELEISKGDGSFRFIKIDPERMIQILDNLIKNAQESSVGMPVSVPPVLSVFTSRNTATFKVSDFGLGVAEKNVSSLFNPFFTTKAQGSGIGLALSLRFAQQAGGTIVYQARSGGGSVFTVSLPVVGEKEST